MIAAFVYVMLALRGFTRMRPAVWFGLRTGSRPRR